MTNFFLKISLLLFLPVSCQIGVGGHGGLLSSRITVIPAPYGVGDTVRSSRPIIFISKGSYTCRPKQVDPRIMINYLEISGLGDSGFANVFGISKEESNQIKSSLRSEGLRPIRVDVGAEGVSEGWLKLGLFISNGNSGTDQSFFLIVDSIGFVATAQYRGESFFVNNDIQAGYCGGEGRSAEATTSGSGANQPDLGSPFLYIVPPGTKVEYNPTSLNPFHNLTLFLSGFPIIDRTKEAAIDQKNRINKAEGINGQEIESSSTEASRRIFSATDPLIYIPRYTVDLTLRGYFMTTEGDLVASFTKRVRFFTQSSSDF